jgi:tRNA nucleotidyltransferase (CCA-adding enzyme)
MDQFNELEMHLMNDKKPSDYLRELRKTGLFESKFPFTLLGDLERTEQSLIHHPEGNAWVHTLLVVDNASARKHLSSNQRVFMWASLLHDLGKAPTTKIRKGKITSYDHEKWGEELTVKFLKEFYCDPDFITKVAKMVRWHMQIFFVIKELPFAEVRKMASEVSIDEIALLGLCDRLGRGDMSREKEEEEIKNIAIFKAKCDEQMSSI